MSRSRTRQPLPADLRARLIERVRRDGLSATARALGVRTETVARCMNELLSVQAGTAALMRAKLLEGNEAA